MSYSRVFRRRLWMMDSSSDSLDTLDAKDSKEPSTHNKSSIVHPLAWVTNLFKTKPNIPYLSFNTMNTLHLANMTMDVYLYVQACTMCIGQSLYQRYASVQWVTKQAHRIYRWVRNVPSEPERSPWFNVTQLVYGTKTLTTRTDDEGEQYIDIMDNIRLKEDYVSCTEYNLPENLNDRWELVTQQQRREENAYNLVSTGALWLYKEASDIYHVRKASSEPIDLEYVKTPIPSTVRFLSVEYKHPLMEHTIPLEIPTTMMYTGNCLFFPAFVARMLRYKCCDMYGGNHQPYVFDLDYTLGIMDKKLQYMELSSNRHVRLNAIDYEIVTEHEK